MTCLDTEHSVAIALVRVIRMGDAPRLKRLSQEDPSLACVRLGDHDACGMSRTLLHVATDWPGQLRRSRMARAMNR